GQDHPADRRRNPSDGAAGPHGR
ncbi:MAG: hypothetical protein AVDCRST_MAG51-2735, partial [uncultured Ramlibacter sp.]